LEVAVAKIYRPKLCACGCGEEVRLPSHRFIHGHNKGNQGKLWNEFSRIKASNNHKGKTSSFKGKHHTEEAKEKNRQAHLGRKASLETKIKMRDKRLGSHASEEARANMSKAKKNQSEETRRKIGAKYKGKVIGIDQRRILSEKLTGTKISEETRRKREGYIPSEETRRKLSISGINSWSNYTEEEKKERIKKIYAFNGMKPNKKEEKLLDILTELFPGEWKFTGDFGVVISGKSPDFTNINGQKKLIELFGDYWHKGQNPQDRIDIFKPFGYDTLVVWEKELKDVQSLKMKIQDFCGRKRCVPRGSTV
jgi:hypothetical protein